MGRSRRFFVAASVLGLAAASLVACVPVPAGPDPARVGCPSLTTESTPAAAPVTSQPSGAADRTVDVDASHTAGPVNSRLTGVVWNTGPDVTPVAPVHPAEVRIDGSLQSRSTGPGQLDLQPLLDRIAAVRAIGAEPLVILSYMPSWLGTPRATAGQDPTRMGPYDLDLWQDLVTTVVRTVATAPQPAYRFEVWNEPDLPTFWQDTPAEFVAMALRTHQAVADVKQETGLPLEIGGPAAAVGPLGTNMLAYVHAVAAAGLPLDFISWHKYANFPYLGPDGPEGNLPLNVYEGLAKRNPNTTPLSYATEIADTKTKVAAAIAGTNLAPRFQIDEWNVSSGGYDVRHDTAEGASLDAGILIEMERAGLTSADFYRSQSGSHIGDWGLVFEDGTPKPSWWVFRAWTLMTGSRLVTFGDDPAGGLWARATRDDGCVSVLLTNFVATGAPARTVTVRLDGELPRCAGARDTSLAVLDADSTSLADAQPVVLTDAMTVSVPMASQSVALLRVSCADQPASG
jgi:hypothetical protein